MKDKKTILGLIATAFVLILTFVYLQFPAGFAGAQSESGTDLRGWAWSNNIGWVSFNTSDYGGADYKVTMSSDGKLSGYAWSLNLGWIKFDPSLYDSANCGSTGDCYGAKLVEGTPNQLKGWARVCSVYVSGCSGTLRSSAELGGWNGWIRMYNVTQGTNGGFSGYAWGDLNMGWLSLGLNLPGGDCDSATQCCEGDTSATNPNCSVGNCPVTLVGDCCPAWQTCGGGSCDSSTSCCSGDTYPENLNCALGDSQVSVAVDSPCVGTTFSFEPDGPECGSNCRSFSVGETVIITFEGEILPDSINGGCQDYDSESGICTIPNIDRDYNLVAVCEATDITQCEPRLTASSGSVAPLKLSETGLVKYPALSGPNKGTLELVNVNTNVPCTGIGYNLTTEEFLYAAGSHSSSDDQQLAISCQSFGGGTYSVSNCNGLTGGTPVSVKAWFSTRPSAKAATWHLQMTATDAGSGEPSHTFGSGADNNYLIQYSRPFGSK